MTSRIPSLIPTRVHTPRATAAMISHGNYITEKVTYPSHGETLAGVLYRPKDVHSPPGVVVSGPYSFTKEQASTQYALRLAGEGYAALAFDPRTVGESTGNPRCLGNSVMKSEDVISGLDYLTSRGDVDGDRLFLAGICQGGLECLDVASYEPRVKAVASVGAYYRNHETDAWMICTGCANLEPGANMDSFKLSTSEQGEALYQARIKRAKEAKKLYEETEDAFAQPVVWFWYNPWGLQGVDNRHAISDLDQSDFAAVPGVAKLGKPALLIRNDDCMNAAAIERRFDSMLACRKRLTWNDVVSRFKNHDHPDCVENNVGEVAAWFADA